MAEFKFESTECEGKILKENLDVAKVDKSFVDKLLKMANIKNVKKCIVMTVDKEGRVYSQKQGEKFVTFEVDL